VIGEFLGLPGNDRRVNFRIFHVFELTDGLISREQVWIDSAAIVAQLSAP
jgi:predicted ester cyclase